METGASLTQLAIAIYRAAIPSMYQLTNLAIRHYLPLPSPSPPLCVFSPLPLPLAPIDKEMHKQIETGVGYCCQASLLTCTSQEDAG